MTSSRARSRRDRVAGFLLTETLATFTISAFVLLGLVSASSVILRNVDGNVARVEDTDDLGQTMRAIERDISGLSRARWNGDEPQPFVFRGGPNSLYFAHAERDASGRSSTQVVALREIVAGRGTRLTRGEAHLGSRARGFEDLHFGPQRELGTGAARLRFSYVMPGHGKPEASRTRQWTDARLLPAAIVVEAISRDGGRPIISMSVPIQANADIGCLEHDDSRDEAGPPPPGSMAALDAAITENEAKSKSEEPRSFCGREIARDGKDTQRSAVPEPTVPREPSP